MIDECDSDDGSTSYTKIEETTTTTAALKIEEFIMEEEGINEGTTYFDDVIAESQVEEDSVDDERNVKRSKPTQKVVAVKIDESPTVAVQNTGSEQRFEEDNGTTNYEVMSFDDNDKFLLSCAPALRRLTKRKNALARIKILSALFEIEFDESSNTEEGGTVNSETPERNLRHRHTPLPIKKFKKIVCNSNDNNN